MIVLGIESTAHTFGVGIVEDETVLSNRKAVYEPEKGGIHPRKAVEHHYSRFQDVLSNAIDDAEVDEKEIDAVAFSQGPGIPQCLQIGGVVARSFAQAIDVPLVGVNHCIAHIEIGRLTTGADDPVTLYVSGGNSQVIGYAGGKYRIFGETLDIAAGNAIDKVARQIGIPHPGGPELENRAKGGDQYIELPYVVKGMDFSFAGLVTDTQRSFDQHDVSDVCYSFQENLFAMLVEASERAMAHMDNDEVLVTGGVAANKRLQEMLEQMAEQRGGTAYKVPHEYCMDNGGMIAYTGLLKHRAGHHTSIDRSGEQPDWRTDEVEVNWR